MSEPRAGFCVAQMGARRYYAVPRMLHAAELLDRLYVDATAAKGLPALLRWVPRGLQPAALRRLLGRVPEGIPADKIQAFNAFGVKYTSRVARTRDPELLAEVQLWGGSTFARHVADAIGDAVPLGVYAFHIAGLELLRHAREHGRLGVLDQTIAPYRFGRRLLREESERHPGWEELEGARAAGERMADREEAEWDAASLILCGSEFVRESVVASGAPAERCSVVPYEADDHFFSALVPRPHGGALRVLSVGQVGLRKGFPYALAAARELGGAAQFRAVGAIGVSDAARRELAAHIELVGPLPRSELAAQYAWADVFLLPSILEGSAGVVYEALSAGLPVVTTPNAGSVVRDGVEGFIVPIRDASAICDRLTRLADSPELLGEMSGRARERMQEFTLEANGRRLVSALRGHLAVRG